MMFVESIWIIQYFLSIKGVSAVGDLVHAW